MTLHSWLRRRESGFPARFGDGDSVHRAIYYSLEPKKSWNDQRNACNTCEYGGAYNLEFSPDGSILVAACEKKTIVLFDPVTEKQMCTIKNAHNDSVNCVKFLDNRMFATCSDDTTVALWDTRNLKSKIRSLHGHSNWVKNIEYSKKDCLLVTSGFDGSIFTWDINSYTEHGFVYQKVFHTPGLMRCRLVPDENRLVICTTGGYLIIIHNLNLASLAMDLRGFRPNLYRLMQSRQQFIPNAARYGHAFSKKQKSNRVELVSDFPEGNDAEVISSLQIHPQGWCALSRNISYDESSEWSCVHDIQEISLEDDAESDGEDDSTGAADSASGEASLNQDASTAGEGGGGGAEEGGGGAGSGAETQAEAAAAAALVNAAVGEPAEPNNVANGNRNNNNNNNQGNNADFPTPNSDIWAAEVSLRNRNLRVENTRSLNMANVYGITSGLFPLTPVEHQNKFQQTITVNVNRMLYYIEEPNKGKGFIKEPCFSSDGRIICSPHAHGIRLLAFNAECNELPFITDRANEGPRQFHEIKRKHCHSDVVVSSKFSPKFPLLVSGCLRGKIVWHQPVL